MDKIRNLITELNMYTWHYDNGEPLISDEQYDELYFELERLEKEIGIVYPDSPTQTINYQVQNALDKVKHSHPMLSLAKTKSIDDIKAFAQKYLLIAMPKLDGLTCSLTYQDRKLVRAETRGNGVIGEDVTHNARVISNIPQSLPRDYLFTSDTVVIDGEVICEEDNFQSFSDEYDNPRNFAAGSIRLLDSHECAKRHLSFVAWDCIRGLDDKHYLSDQLLMLRRFGFDTVSSSTVDADTNIEKCIKEQTNEAALYGYPIDGIVFKIDNISLYESQGKTNHHFRGGIAYKFYDETVETTLTDIEWSMGRTGLITPIAIFEPIRINDTTVSRASLHNLNIMNALYPDKWYKGLKLHVCKRNMIIPNVEEVEDGEKKGDIEMLNTCPSCGRPLNNVGGMLYCENPTCEGKLINRLDHFCGKKGLDIKGLSTATLQKLIDWGWVNNLNDIFRLSQKEKAWKQKDGFGAASVNKILTNIENARRVRPETFIAALGIPNIGTTAARDIIKKCHTWSNFRIAVDEKFKFSTLKNFGPEMEKSILAFDYTEADKIAKFLTFDDSESERESNNVLNGKTFVITGKLKTYRNRQALVQVIEENGGKVTDKVTSKTTYLINNDINSGSAKNLAAKELGIPIITEEGFQTLLV